MKIYFEICLNFGRSGAKDAILIDVDNHVVQWTAFRIILLSLQHLLCLFLLLPLLLLGPLGFHKTILRSRHIYPFTTLIVSHPDLHEASSFCPFNLNPRRRPNGQKALRVWDCLGWVGWFIDCLEMWWQIVSVPWWSANNCDPVSVNFLFAI